MCAMYRLLIHARTWGNKIPAKRREKRNTFVGSCCATAIGYHLQQENKNKTKKTHATCLTGLHKNDDSQWLFNTLATRQRAHAMQSYRDTSGREQFFFFFLPTTSPIFKSQMFDSKFLKSTFSHSRWHRLTTRGELTAFRSCVWHLQCLHKGGYTWYYSFFFRIVGLWKKSENLGKIQSLSAIHIQIAGPSTFRCEAQGCLASINKDRKRKRRISFLSSPLLFFPLLSQPPRLRWADRTTPLSCTDEHPSIHNSHVHQAK